MIKLPPAFLHRISTQFSSEISTQFLESLSENAATSIRVNTKKITTPLFENTEKIPWTATGAYLPERPSFTLDPLFHAGAYYVQEASSMFLEEIFNQLHLQEKNTFLDLCAAPGGKSTHIASLISEEALLVSNEVIAARNAVLVENTIKWGVGNSIVVQNDAANFQRIPNFFDAIFVDAPCSGEGLFRKDPNAISEWSEGNCNLCAERQQRIVADVLPALKEGGYLIYSTCTFNPEENEKNIAFFCENFELRTVKIQTEKNWNIHEVEYKGTFSYQFLPGFTKGEGFFVSVLQKKKEDAVFSEKNKNVKSTHAVSKKMTGFLSSFFSTKKEFIEKQGTYYALNETAISFFDVLAKNLYIKYAGVRCGSIIREELIPDHALAMSVHLNLEMYPVISLEKNDALKFLRRDEFELSSSQKGWQLVTCQNMPLGFIKHLGNRWNNYYPTEWRIRMK